jgi:anthranilate phosphoribosyltransferase
VPPERAGTRAEHRAAERGRCDLRRRAAKSIQEGIERARKVIASGEAKAKLDEFIAATNQFRAKA